MTRTRTAATAALAISSALVLAALGAGVAATLARGGLLERLGAGRVHPSVGSALKHTGSAA